MLLKTNWIGKQSRSTSEAEQLVQELKLSYPMVHDADQRIAKMLDAKCTGEVAVVEYDKPKSQSGQGGQIRYRGRMDDQVLPGIRRSTPTTNELREVIEQWLATKTFSVPNTEQVG
jgi:hypothetical protein